MERGGRNGSDHSKLKEPWSFSHCYFGGGGREAISSSLLVGGLSWSPRAYICSFCKREFKSAQALGGHMNVHRRDRARLRAESLTQVTCKPSLTTCFSSSPTYNTSSEEHCSLESRSPKMRKAMKALFELGDLKGFIKEDENTKYRKREAVSSLDLEIGVLSGELKEDLDLELRLGFGLAA